MKLLRFGPRGQEQPGLVDRAAQIRSLAGVVDDLAGSALSRQSIQRLSRLDEASLPLVEQPLGGFTPPGVRILQRGD